MLIDAEKGEFYPPSERLEDGAILIKLKSIEAKTVPQIIIQNTTSSTIYKQWFTTKEKIDVYGED